MGETGRPEVDLLPIATPVPPENTVLVTVPQGYTVVIQRAPADDPTVVAVIADPSPTIVINGTIAATERD